MFTYIVAVPLDGSASREQQRRWLLDSVAERLVHAADVPVLLVRDAAHQADDLY